MLTLTADMIAERNDTTLVEVERRAALTPEMIARIDALRDVPGEDFWESAGKQFSGDDDPAVCALWIVLWDMVKERDARRLAERQRQA